MSSRRLQSLDLLRGLAVVSMVVYHAGYDVEVFADIPVLTALGTAGWLWARGTANTFLLLVGVSFFLSMQRRANWRAVLRRSCVRAAIVLACAIIVSYATVVTEPSTYVRFGVLHLIGIGILLLPFAALLPRSIIALCAIGILLPHVFHIVPSSTSLPSVLSIPLGIPPHGFLSVDYYPLVPWLGVILLGYAMAPWIVRIAEHIDAFPVLHRRFVHALAMPGRYALLIYMVHQPVLMGAGWLISALGRQAGYAG